MLNPIEDAPLIDAVESTEVEFCAEYLIAKRLVLRETQEPEYRLTMDGWRAVDPGPGGIPGRCFVAMWFDDAVLPAWTDGFLPALKLDCGLDPVRIDRGQEFNDKIDDRIIVEIRRAEFVVADVTGHRPSVYFEAGFAMALGRDVIWTCRADHVDTLHFDTRQYPHIPWTTPADLRERLRNRVQATIPRPPA